MNPLHAHDADVLVVDDEDDIRELIELSLLRMGLSCVGAATLGDAHARLARGRFRLCLTDMRLPDGDGLDLVARIQSAHPGLPVAVISAYGSMDTAIRALKLGAFDFVTKPVELKALRELVRHALQLDGRPAAPADGTVLDSAQRLVGASAAMQTVRTQAAKLARSQAPVFIHGESGTGKEIVAREIHLLGPRAQAPFVPVNCGAIPPELMESEFFGHLRGSFSGATADKPGLFHAAQGGTLFLDEVAELPLAMQVKLLRAIQERAVRPVGAHAEEAVDVRILSASHRDLGELVASGRFRRDLFYRINVITLALPALRERAEDIPELADHLLARLAARDGTAWRLTPAARAALARQPLPGNVRELENLLERACALCDGTDIDVPDLHLDTGSTLAGLSASLAPSIDEEHAEPTAASDHEERAHVLRALEATRWNRSAAARKVGLTLRQLRYRLDKWGLD